MAEPKVYSLVIEDLSSNPIKSEVPEENCPIRKAEENNEAAESGVEIKEDNYVPVIKVTKQEIMLSKGDLKLQKVTVTEDIAVKYQHLFKKQVLPGKTVVTTVQKLDYNISK